MQEHLERLLRRLHRWDESVALWQVYEAMANQVWYLRIHANYLCDLVITTREKNFAMAVARRMETENIPIRHVFAMDPIKLGQRLPYMPDVVRVFYSLESQRYAYGPRGYCVPKEGKGFNALI